ncbi:MAG: acyl--CoA ligase [Ruminococcus sp.]|nr:acyl--CoA ligase [Ruminococcus sp.]
MSFKDLYSKLFIQKYNKNFLIYFNGQDRITLTNRDYAKKIDLISYNIQKLFKDISIDSWVGIRCKNNPFWFAVMFALLKNGYNVLLLDENCPDSLLKNYIEQADLKAIVTDSPSALDNIKLVDFIELISVNDVPKDYIPIDSWAENLAFCTSGTTGNAKIFVFNSEPIINQINHLTNAFYSLVEGTNMSVLTFLPFRHCIGFNATITMWNLGVSVVMPMKSNIMGIIQTVKQESISAIVSVPAYLKAITRICKGMFKTLDKSSFNKLMGDSLKIVISGGAKADNETILAFNSVGIDFYNGYGMTEIGIISLGKCDDNHLGDFLGNYISKNITTKILSNDTNLMDSGNGEILVKSDTMFNGVLIDGKVQPPQLYSNTYYQTGDLFNIVDNQLYYIGRDKNVIIGEGGENVYPEELMEHFDILNNLVDQFCIIGISEKPVLVLFTKDSSNINDDLKKTIVDKNSILAIYKKISKVFISKEPLPVTTKGEISLKKVKDIFEKYPMCMNEFNLKG